jgi:hypothetical protein
MCTKVWVEESPRVCEGCGQRYVRELSYLGWHTTLHTRTLVCERPGCGHEWVRPVDAKLVPVLQRCRDNRCPTWHAATPSRPPIPSIAELARELGEAP